MEMEAATPSAGMDVRCPVAGSGDGVDGAATKLQKVYRGYRARRKLADSAVVVEELWWQALDFARLSYSTISFFDEPRPKTTASLWSRVSLKASKVGQGLSRDDGKAIKLAFEHWIEAIDPRHRSGHNLHFYYDVWCQSQAAQPFFYWLDIGAGKDVDLPQCPRALLKKQLIKYLGPQEREFYEYIINDRKIFHKHSGEPLDTSHGPEGANKWIFVLSTSKRLYAGKKEKGVFQHSSFLAGGATIAAGRFIAENGVIKSIWAYSGHYKPSAENLSNFMNFLEENGVDVTQVEVGSFTKEFDDSEPTSAQNLTSAIHPLQVILPGNETECWNNPENQTKPTYERTLSGGLQSPKATDVPKNAILDRMKSKSESKSYQLGDKLSLKWSSGVGPRIGCVNDYPVELKTEALEMVDLSPRASTPSTNVAACTNSGLPVPAKFEA